MNQKRVIYIILGVLLAISILIILYKCNRIYSSDISYSNSDKVMDDNGMYYFQGDYLMYLDQYTGQSSAVCSRAECMHSDETCDACYAGTSGGILLLYENRLYIACFTANQYTDVDGQIKNQSKVQLISLNKDGTDKKTIYKSDSGAVVSMLAMDGKLYYACYTEQVQDINRYYSDSYLYCYDMSWGFTKQLLKYEGTENTYDALLQLCQGSNRQVLYMLYSYHSQVQNGDYITELITLDSKGNVISNNQFKKNIFISDVQIRENDIYILYYDDLYDDNLLEQLICRNESEDVEIIFASDDYAFSNLDGYYYAVKDGKEKVLYDCIEKKYYKARIMKKDIPDIWLVDRKQDVVYYDMTDYTGVEPGTVYTENPSNPGCMKWSVFCAQYFTECEDYIMDMKEVQWGDICGY